MKNKRHFAESSAASGQMPRGPLSTGNVTRVAAEETNDETTMPMTRNEYSSGMIVAYPLNQYQAKKTAMNLAS